MDNISNLLNKQKKKLGTVCTVFLFVLLFCYSFLASGNDITYGSISFTTPEEINYKFLSDMNYITENNWSYNGWSGHTIQLDKNPEGGVINLIVNGEKRPFAKGIGLHARGQVTYDISELSADYPRFIAKLGVDASRGTNGKIWFQIFVSNDGNNWTSLLKTDALTGTSEAVSVDLNVEGYKYLRIYVDPVGDISSDHGDIANAKLVTRDYVLNEIPYDRIHKVEYYDNILKNNTPEDNYNNNHKDFLVRELVNKLGYWNIQSSVESNPNISETLDWILDNNTILEEAIEVGEISNGSLFLKVLSDLYHNYKSDLNTPNGYVYEKMMIASAAAYSTDRIINPLSFGFQTPSYDYVERFKIMKDFYDNNEFRKVTTNALAGTLEAHNWFKDYHVDLMRMVMQDGTSNIDLKWLNGFTNEKQSVSFYMIGYVSPTYTLDKYYAEDNREKYDNQYYLTKYGVPYGLINGAKIPRYWMVFANGGICWNASRVGQSMFRVNGIPATGAYQVGHELYIHYYENANGDGYWTTRYGNWSGAGSTWGGANPYRYIFNWNNKYFADKHISGSKVASSTGYLYLGQDNLNHYEAYKESAYYNLIANSYDDKTQKLAAYNKALEVNDINLDTYDGIINVYKVMSQNNEISSDDWYELALKIIDAYEFHPVAMFDLLKVVRPYLEGSKKLHIDTLERETLQRATTASGNDTIFAGSVRVHANQLLYKTQPDPMSFSFDGNKGGVIVKNPIYQLAWGYSLDGGNTWAKFDNNGMETEYTDADEIVLTEEELTRITSQNDIQFKFMGLADFKFTIDIVDGTISSLLYGNDLENRVVGIDLTYEWRNSANDSWTSYKMASPNNTGNKTLEVRRGATGNTLPSESQTFTFTEDNQPNTRKYVPVSHLSIDSFSTESIDANRPFYAPNAIDGNGKTLWHTDFRENVLTTGIKPFITIKLDKPRYISAVEFKQLKYRSDDPVNIKNARIYISEDGEKWVEAGKIENCPQDEELRVVDFTESIYGEYIKIEMDTYDIFSCLSLVNVFQDMTKNPRPTAGIGYSTTEPTTENVIARLVNVSTEHYEILTPGGDTHEFTENGEFTFRFKDTDTGVEGTSLAKVDWIDRTAPTATIEYSTKNPINSSVYVTLKPSEVVKVLNNGYYSIDEDGKVYDTEGNLLSDYTVDENGVVKDSGGKIIDPLKYEFLDNGEFIFEFVDLAGNKGTATATVDWIDFEEPKATLTYSKDTLTNEDVTVTISFNEEASVTNNNRSQSYIFKDNGEFTFDFRDLAGNSGSVTAKVNWIDKTAPTADLKYENVDDKVVVTVVNSSEEITFAEGIGVYEFSKNGNYEIVFYDKAGNEGKLVAVITSFKDDPENPDDNKPDEPIVDPDNPDKPDDKEPDKPSKPNEGNKPTVPNKPTNPSNPSEENPDEPVNIDYKKYTEKSVTVLIPANIINGEFKLKVEEFALLEELKGKFGDLSEFYNIYLTDENLTRVEVSSKKPLKISIKLKTLKDFIGVYEITNDNTIKPVNYTKNGGNIEITANNLGKYVVSYKELVVVEPKEPVNSNNKKEKLIIVTIVIIGTLIGSIVYLFKKPKSSNFNR